MREKFVDFVDFRAKLCVCVRARVCRFTQTKPLEWMCVCTHTHTDKATDMEKDADTAKDKRERRRRYRQRHTQTHASLDDGWVQRHTQTHTKHTREPQ
jgi:hypothetical protein